MTANIRPLHDDTYAKARDVIAFASNDWPQLLGAAQTLSQSAGRVNTLLSEVTNTAHSLHLAGLLKPVDPSHRDRSDMIDQWKEAAMKAHDEETPVRIAMQHAPKLAAAGVGVVLAVLAIVAVGL